MFLWRANNVIDQWLRYHSPHFYRIENTRQEKKGNIFS